MKGLSAIQAVSAPAACTAASSCTVHMPTGSRYRALNPSCAASPCVHSRHRQEVLTDSSREPSDQRQSAMSSCRAQVSASTCASAGGGEPAAQAAALSSVLLVYRAGCRPPCATNTRQAATSFPATYTLSGKRALLCLPWVPRHDEHSCGAMGPATTSAGRCW